jgi:endonuclease/exonuclease/phosphatase family metal-dependent hydrolase
MKKILLASCWLFLVVQGMAQNKSKEFIIRSIAFYNLENLFDTIDNPDTYDEASPILELKENKAAVYWDKIDKLASVLAQIGADKTHTAPSCIGLAEVENREVLEDLIKSKYLKPFDFEIIHYDSPDTRGIDVAFLYQKTHFNPINHEVFSLLLFEQNKRIYTRDQLLVSGYLDNELIHFIVNHWPSRRGGEAKSRHLREKAAYVSKTIINGLKEQDLMARIMVMGDFNDDPINSSFKTVLETRASKKKLQNGDLFNPFENLFKKGYHTLGHRDQINLFDQIILSASLTENHQKHPKDYFIYKAGIFNKSFLTTQNGKYKGYPFRSFSNGNYTGGYSDHYPVYVHLIKEK